MRVGIFGGSFDPVHAGHVGVVKRAVEDKKLEKVYVIPAACSPFKTNRRYMFSDAERLEKVRTAFAGVPQAVVDDRELKKGGTSFAIDTVKEIAAENPGAELYYITGSDCVEGLPRWKNYDELIKLCTFIAYPRTPESSTQIRNQLLSL